MEMFEGDSADMCAEKFPLMLMGGQAVGLACADPGARTPIDVSGNLLHVFHVSNGLHPHCMLFLSKSDTKCSGDPAS